MRVFKHKENGKYYRLEIERVSKVNTYIEVDEDNKKILKKVRWTFMKSEQKAIISGFDKLIEL